MAEAAASIVFTGHMIDLPERASPRFPAALEAAAAAAIRTRIARAMAPGMIGFASGARGGDILFHEAARSLGLPTMVVLPFAADIFEATSVAGVPSGDWSRRFRDLWNGTDEAHRLDLGLPEEDESFAICNARLIDLAAARGRFHLIALWDRKPSGLPGGTDDLVRRAQAQGAAVDIIAPAELPA